MIRTLQEAPAHGWRGAKQIDQQPRAASEVTNQAEIRFSALLLFGNAKALPQRVGYRKVVVDAGDRLHQATIAMAETAAVHGFGHAYV